MEYLQGFGNLANERERIGQRHRTVGRQPVLEAVPFEQLHRQARDDRSIREPCLAWHRVLHQVEHPTESLVSDVPRDENLAPESSDRIRVSKQLRADCLECDLQMESLVVDLIDPAHRAAGDRLDHAEPVADAITDLKQPRGPENDAVRFEEALRRVVVRTKEVRHRGANILAARTGELQVRVAVGGRDVEGCGENLLNLLPVLW